MRTDIHRPSVIHPEEYQFVGIWYDQCAGSVVGGDMLLKEEREQVRRFMDDHGAQWATHEHGGTCQCCGANAAYLAVFYHEHHRECIRVGEDCAKKIGLKGLEAFNSARRKVSEGKKAMTNKSRAEEALRLAGLSVAWEMYEGRAHYQGEEHIVQDLVGKLVRFGGLSEKQWEFLKSLMYRIENREKIEAQREAERAFAADCPTGRMEIKGTIISVKTVETPWGQAQKMLVKTLEGYTVWGTVPRGIDAEKGKEVAFTATLEPSKDDKKHGYFSRPSAQRKA